MALFHAHPWFRNGLQVRSTLTELVEDLEALSQTKAPGVVPCDSRYQVIITSTTPILSALFGFPYHICQGRDLSLGCDDPMTVSLGWYTPHQRRVRILFKDNYTCYVLRAMFDLSKAHYFAARAA